MPALKSSFPCLPDRAMSGAKQSVFYFSFGSNLLQERIRIRNPSAQYVGIGLLKDYLLTFFEVPQHLRPKDNQPSWCGGPATIRPSPGSEVYGTVWALDPSDVPSLDKQEGVEIGLYTPLDPIEVVFVSSGEKVKCRTYQGMEAPNALPSPYYLDVVLRGAVKTKLPEHYIENQRQTHTNGYEGECGIYQTVMQMLPEAERPNYEAPFLQQKFAR